MRRGGPLTPRHLLAAVLVVVLVNAQLSWWIIFVLEQNRSRLRLERQEMISQGRVAVERVRRGLAAAREELATAVARGETPATAQPPGSFSGWQVVGPGACEPGWRFESLRLAVDVETAGGCVSATAAEGWQAELLAPGSGLEVVPAVDLDVSGPPAEVLPAPLAFLAVRPLPGRWHELLDEYRGRIVMMVSEGSFFAIMLFVLLWLLVRTLQREAELERRHRNFLSAITHELKSPLASMRLSLETVLSGRASGDRREHFLGNALNDTERLQDLVQKVLEVTRYDRGGGRLELSRVPLSDVVEEATAAFAPRARLKGGEVDVDVEPDVWGRGDQEALRIVVSNLLENAVKYGGRPPRVRVTLAVADGSAVLDVRDNGAGIPADDVSLVFERFFRGGDEMTRTTEGTGLGLYLVRQIVTAHHGVVRVAETGPGGTTFRVTLPDAAWEEPQA